MNFYDTITSMGYSVKDKMEGKISIKKPGMCSDTIIIFELNTKKMTGFLMPKELLYDVDQISNIYADLGRLKKDLEELSKVSGYDII